MSRNYDKEVTTIKLILEGSRWAYEVDMPAVLREYKRLLGSDGVRDSEKRAALLILYASRAIDTFLSIVVRSDCRAKREPEPAYSTIDNSLKRLHASGFLDARAYKALTVHVKEKRNRYLHKADVFPSRQELERFIHESVDGIRAVCRSK